MEIQAQQQLLRHRQIWERKPVLRRIYREEFFARMLLHRKKEGPCVEVGGGPGYFKESFASVISTDVVWCPWLDVVADAQILPFRSCSTANLFGMDVLHHLAAPMEFLREAQRILTPGGRLILVEPWITPFSSLIYRYLHQEECDLSACPWDVGRVPSQLDKKAFDGNQAVPYLLFGPKQLERTMSSLPAMRPLVTETFSLFAYLLSLGFKPTNLLPEFLYPAISTLERTTSVVWRRLAALRVLIVIEKTF